MAEKVLMIALSPTMETGLISKWEKEEGERVESGDLLCQVETDKATMDYESIQEGTLLKILVREGEQAGIGSPIAIIGETGEDIAEILAEIEAETKDSPSDGTEEVKEEVAATPAIEEADRKSVV